MTCGQVLEALSIRVLGVSLERVLSDVITWYKQQATGNVACTLNCAQAEDTINNDGF